MIFTLASKDAVSCRHILIVSWRLNFANARIMSKELYVYNKNNKLKSENRVVLNYFKEEYYK